MQCTALDRIQNHVNVGPSSVCGKTLWRYLWTDLHKIWNIASPAVSYRRKVLSSSIRSGIRSCATINRGRWKGRSGKHGSENRGTTLYVKVFEKVSALVAQFARSCAVAHFHEASVSAFHHVCQDAVVVGCWFHYAQAVMKRCNKIGLKKSYGRNVDVATIVHCLHTAESAVASCLRYPWQQDAVSVGGKPFRGRTHGVIPSEGWRQQQQQRKPRRRQLRLNRRQQMQQPQTTVVKCVW